MATLTRVRAQFYAEIWIVGDFARLKLNVYTSGTEFVLEVTKTKGSGTITSRFFQQIKATMETSQVLSALSKLVPLQPVRAALVRVVCARKCGVVRHAGCRPMRQLRW